MIPSNKRLLPAAAPQPVLASVPCWRVGKSSGDGPGELPGKRAEPAAAERGGGGGGTGEGLPGSLGETAGESHFRIPPRAPSNKVQSARLIPLRLSRPGRPGQRAFQALRRLLRLCPNAAQEGSEGDAPAPRSSRPLTGKGPRATESPGNPESVRGSSAASARPRSSWRKGLLPSPEEQLACAGRNHCAGAGEAREGREGGAPGRRTALRLPPCRTGSAVPGSRHSPPPPPAVPRCAPSPRCRGGLGPPFRLSPPRWGKNRLAKGALECLPARESPSRKLSRPTAIL